jgi:hypothetical protein
MKTLLSLFGATILALVLGSSALAQDAMPAATPRPRPPIADDKQLLISGSFELPRVKERTASDKGGTPIKFSQGEWMALHGNQENTKGEVVAGLSNEQAHTGKQGLYVEFRHARTPSAGIVLTSALIRIKPSEKYRINIWGKMDAKSPILLDQLDPSLRLQADFFQADGQTQTGDSLLQTQPIPGVAGRPLFFTSEGWNEYYAEPTAPEDAAFIKVTWTVLMPTQGGEVAGTIYFDDAGIRGEKPVDAPEPPDAPAEGTAPAAGPAVPAPAVATPAKAP